METDFAATALRGVQVCVKSLLTFQKSDEEEKILLLRGRNGGALTVTGATGYFPSNQHSCQRARFNRFQILKLLNRFSVWWALKIASRYPR